MPMQDYFLWSALCLLGLELIHFIHQRKLNDRRTQTLFAMFLISMVICICGIIMSRLLEQRLAQTPVMLLASTVIYLAQLTLPFLLTCMVCLTCHPGKSRIVRLTAIPYATGCCLILLNPFTGWIAHAEADGLWHVATGYSALVHGIMTWYLLNLFFVLFHYKNRKDRRFISLSEVALLLLAGMFLQNIFHIRLFVGFTAALAITILHLTLNNPYAYIDFTSRIFNLDYFRYWISECFSYDRKKTVTVIEITQLDHIRHMYRQGTDLELLEHVSHSLWNMTPKHMVFRSRSNRFLLCTDTPQQQDQLIQELYRMFSQEFQLAEVSIVCPALICKIPDTTPLQNTQTLLSYIKFLLQQVTPDRTTQVLDSTEELYQTFRYEQQIEYFLTEAVEKNLFEVYYQPLFSVSEKRFIGVEALSRLHHPTLGWISPELFIRIATRNHLLYRIMPLQLHKICEFLRAHPRELEEIQTVKINLSPAELTKPGYCEQLLEIIDSYQLPASRFQFEVTETTATQYTADLNLCITRLQQAGIALCLDDFGSGYANLSSILRLPFSVVKIDRSLLLNVCEDQKSRDFYESMVNALKKIGYTIVAEGVENQGEATYMEQWGVDMIQGYYYAIPQPPTELLLFLHTRNQGK